MVNKKSRRSRSRISRTRRYRKQRAGAYIYNISKDPSAKPPGGLGFMRTLYPRHFEEKNAKKEGIKKTFNEGIQILKHELKDKTDNDLTDEELINKVENIARTWKDSPVLEKKIPDFFEKNRFAFQEKRYRSSFNNDRYHDRYINLIRYVTDDDSKTSVILITELCFGGNERVD
jgi:hypothetical protein